MNTRTVRSLSATALALLIIAGSPRDAGATPLAPGTTVVPGILAGDPGTLLASTSQTQVSSTGDWTATVIAAVYRNAAGLVDFFYQINNSSASASSIQNVNNSSFIDVPTTTTYVTDVGYRTFLEGSMSSAGFVTPTGTPTNSRPVTADRTVEGSTVSFDFGAGAAPTRINPGEISPILVIRTDAAAYESGFTTLQNGGVGTYNTYDPAGPAIPEPGSMLLFGSGLFGLAALARRRFGVVAR